MNQSHGMNLYVAGNDEFHPHQTNAIVGQEGMFKGHIWISEKKRHFGLGLWNRGKIHLVYRKRLDAVIHSTSLASTAINRDGVTMANVEGCVTASNQARNSKLSRNDGRVTCASSTIGDDSRRLGKNGFAVRISLFGHKDAT